MLSFFGEACNKVLKLSQVYEDGKTTMSIYERKASLKDFYGK